ncbi:hypothetical protein WSK_2519 [Novosphingobium sp. Rr 2-17]|uniref:hypothetical protein n=1 Tax=Novosphingobium sp. Rr 2-17 TaxID=555793 RepID=UPI0002697B7A|nr:hypothetical protein [Novosphingobium sp. Rr 2-17]EIZ78976.1 hypothetical protein WSK_2519 [Novosphingobium sp. Rr 2-17]
MKRTAAVLALVAALMATGAEAKPRRALPPGPGTANPSVLVATEIAFGRMAAKKGQWTAFRKFADDTGVMFVPQTVQAKAWLKGRKNPARAITWQPHQVWMSCDGTLGVTKGAWQQSDGTVGYFTTVWKRQKNGTYRWVMEQGDTLPKPLAPPEMTSAKVGACVQRPGATSVGTPIVVTSLPMLGGASDDGSLVWSVRVDAKCGRVVSVRLDQGGTRGLAEVFSDHVAPPRSQAATSSKSGQGVAPVACAA